MLEEARHLKEEILGSKGEELKGKRIALCITGSPSAFRCPEIARELMRHGAEVYVVMSQAAQQLITPDLMEWATGNPVLTKLGGRTEHIELAGDWEGRVDLVLIAPCTSNTAAKVAWGIDDTPVTTVASCALGSGIPLAIAPAMHQPMARNPFVVEALNRLKGAGAIVIEPQLEEGKAKLAPTWRIVEVVLRLLGPKDMEGKRILVTAGPTLEPLDAVRVITNRSSGRMGLALAREAWRRGAEVTLLHGPLKEEPPSTIRSVAVESSDEMLEALEAELRRVRYDAVISAAAPADFRPASPKQGKVPSRGPALKIELVPTKKIIKRVKELSPNTLLVAFKAEYNVSPEELLSKAKGLMEEVGADLVVANDVARPGVGFGSPTNEVLLVKRDGESINLPKARKDVIAYKIMEELTKLL